MNKFIDVEQNSDEWFSLRAGKLTSSNMGVVMANYNKSFGVPAKKYAVNIAIEQITKNKIGSDYYNIHMQRGIEQEPIARLLYEQNTFENVTNGGFFDCGFFGCSPDGLVNKDGVIEIKSVIPITHYDNIKRGNIDPAYKWQCIANLKYTDRDYLDFISYCSDFPPNKNLYVYRMFKDNYKDEFDMIDNRVEEFKKLVIETKEIIINSDYYKL